MGHTYTVDVILFPVVWFNILQLINWFNFFHFQTQQFVTCIHCGEVTHCLLFKIIGLILSQTCAYWSSSMCLIASSSSILCLSTVFSLRTSSFLRADTSLSRSASCHFNCATSDSCFCCANSCFKESDCSCIMLCSCWLSLDCSPDLIPNKIVSKHIFIKSMINC